MKVKGKAIKYGENVDTDAIIPARYLNTFNPQELAEHCFEDIDPSFREKAKPGDIIVAGHNFGSGSSREHAPLAIKAAGISCVLAKTFARIFYRNSINIGLSILECSQAAEDIKDGEEVEIDFSAGIIKNLSNNHLYKIEAFPAFIQGIISKGGLINYVKETFNKEENRR
ncbi:MAG: 3-isopropylmalate dehydratase small subunit [Candidatus Aminicenantales bacterium]